MMKLNPDGIPVLQKEMRTTDLQAILLHISPYPSRLLHLSRLLKGRSQKMHSRADVEGGTDDGTHDMPSP